LMFRYTREYVTKVSEWVSEGVRGWLLFVSEEWWRTGAS
jgi:hypothetical protein